MKRLVATCGLAFLVAFACTRIPVDSRPFPCTADADCLEGWSCPEVPLGAPRVCRQVTLHPGNVDAGHAPDAGTAEEPDAGIVEEPDAGTSALPDPCGIIAGGSLTPHRDGNEWTLQLGGALVEDPSAVARAADGSIYVAGAIIDPSNLGMRAFLLKLDPDGEYAWCALTSPVDGAAHAAWNGVVVDVSGNVFLAGSTNAPVVTGAAESGSDLMVASYAADGTPRWIKQFDFSVTGRLADEEANAVVLTPEGRLLVVGHTNGRVSGEPVAASDGQDAAIFALVGTDGSLVEAHTVPDKSAFSVTQAAAANDDRTAAAIYSGHSLKGSLELGGEGYLTLAGVPAAGRPTLGAEVAFGGTDTEASAGPRAMYLPGSDTVVAGGIASSLLGLVSLGHEDAFVMRFGASGAVAWKARFGSSAIDTAEGVAPCGTDVCAAGTTLGTISGAGANLGGSDGFVVRLSGTKGDVITIARFGTGADDTVRGATGDGSGGLLVIGRTDGDLGRRQRGSGDLFVRRVVP